MTVRQKTCLICIDGWGISTELKGNAVENASIPVMRKLMATYPTVEISAHGFDVGLPDGLMGNSEVGHLNIGAGRIVYQVRSYRAFFLFIRILFVSSCL
jgi:2,3-bisphosphoglycerate-independent phosphoglycerate mutase